MAAADPPAAAMGSLAFHTATLITFLSAGSAPTPLYQLYQQAWHFSPGMLTAIFGIYAGFLLLALLMLRGLSDHLGRRPVILGAMALQALALVLFLRAEGVGWLLLARAVQGLATGIATTVVGAAMLDADRHRGPLVNSIGPLGGMGLGALGAGLLVELAPHPRHLVFALLLGALLLQAALLWLVPETAPRRPGLWRSLRPKLGVPPQARTMLRRLAPLCIAIWALGGFFLSLVPSLIREATGSRSAITGGLVVAALAFSGAAAMLALRQRPMDLSMRLGAWALGLGTAVVLAGLHAGLVALFFLGGMIAGAGLGASFLGASRSLLPLALPQQRAGLLSAFYLLCYLAFSLPVLLAGLVANHLGLSATTDLYGLGLLLLIGATLLRARAPG